MVNDEAQTPSGPAPLDPAHCVFRHVSKLARAVSAAYDQALAPAGLTAQQFNLMMTLRNYGPSLVGKVAHVLGMHGSTVPRVVAPLSERGWISISPGRDRRERILALTAEGERALAKALPAWERVQSAMLARVGAPAWQALTPSLKGLADVARSVSRGS